jgi:hypothetical protein
LTAALAAAQDQLGALDQNELAGTPGVYLEIYTLPSLFDPDKFELRRHGIFIASVTKVDEELRVVVFVPHTALYAFQKALAKYRYENTKKGKPKEAGRFERIERFALGSARSLWTENTEFPTTDVPIWWEVWLFAEREDHFIQAAEQRDIVIKAGRLEYPELVVRLVSATPKQIDNVVRHTDAVSELRAAPKTPDLITHLPIEAQHELLAGAVERLEPVPPDAPVVCVLDSGLNEAHPLIRSATSSGDAHSWNASWGTQDNDNHGTPMASIALFGDLLEALVSSAALRPVARLESVKLITGAAPLPEPELFGVVTRDSVSIVESVRPGQRRVFVSGVSMNDEGNNGLPTEWSSEYDALAAAPQNHRLFIIAGGNVDGSGRCVQADYPQANWLRPFYEPAQAYNVLTIGGYTERVHFLNDPYDEYHPLAPGGGLSPVSRTGVLWAENSLVPTKPDIVLEAGNFAGPAGAIDAEVMDDYLFVAAGADFRTQPYCTFGYTSGAAAEAARLASHIMADQPNLWPETVRGLLVHSADWTPFMLEELDAMQNKGDRALLLRRYGYGVPSLARALRSANNDATMIVQGSMRPFFREGGVIKTNELVAYSLPWPSDFLLERGDMPVEIKVTLSYFIEPNPGRRGWKGRYSYASHGLRFDVRRATESEEEFMRRVNRLGREEDYKDPGHDDAWLIGSDARSRGSVHSDVWRGTAADIANAGRVAVFPVSGWWRYLESQHRWNSEARYALLITLRTPDIDVDIYSQIETLVETQVEVENQT